MRSILTGLLLASVTAIGVLSAPVPIATAFADAYSAFAPIYALHEGYAEYLFAGNGTSVPSGLAGACEAFAVGLAHLHLVFLDQTGSVVVALPRGVVRLRAEADAFCVSWGETLAEIASSETLDLRLAEEASEGGLFAGIYVLNGLLESTFSETFEAIDGDERRWRFSVAFAARVLVDRESILRVNENLDEILYGAPGRTEPPFPVAAGVAEAMAELVALSGRDLTAEEAERARALAAQVHAFFAAAPSG